MKIIRYSDTINEATKRGDITTLVVKIGDTTFFNREASNTFVEVIEFISKSVGIEKFINDSINSFSGRKFIGLKEIEFPSYVRNVKRNSTGQFLINTHMSTSEKKIILDSLFEFFNIEGTVEIRNRIDAAEVVDVDVNVDSSDELDKYYLLGAYSGKLGTGERSDLWKTYVDGGYWLNGFSDSTDTFKLKDIVNKIPIGAHVAIKSSYVRGKVNPVIMIKARGLVTKNYGDGTKIDVDWEKDFKPFEIIRNDVGGYRQTLHDITDKQEHIDLIFNSESNVIDTEEDNKVDTYTSKFGAPSNFKAIQAEEEKKELKEYDKNPFRQSICVLGKSGKGKSTTVEKILDGYGEEMDYDFIIPTASTTNLLSQYSPVANDYIKSRLGKLIMDAYEDHNKLFTAVFDECHKSNVIEMINDELLQCISLYRNQGYRFISLDDDTAKLYKGLKTRTGNLLIPDNVGFIFLSSKPDVIISNSDFFNRVDIYVLTKQPPRGKEDISFEDIEYFTPVGNRENGSKSLGDIDRIKELNDAD